MIWSYHILNQIKAYQLQMPIFNFIEMPQAKEMGAMADMFCDDNWDI